MSLAIFINATASPRTAAIAAPETETVILGSKVGIPIFVPPMAAHGLAHVTAEKGTAKGAADAGALFCAQTLANSALSASPPADASLASATSAQTAWASRSASCSFIRRVRRCRPRAFCRCCSTSAQPTTRSGPTRRRPIGG